MKVSGLGKPARLQQPCQPSGAHMTNTASINCRLCGGPSKKIFSQTILQKYNVGYYKCDTCSSLQTDEPYWLETAHKNNLSYLDTGAAQRTLKNLAVCFFIS